MIITRGRDLAYYKALYATIEPLPRCIDQIRKEADRVYSGYMAYKAVEEQTGVPWIFHGAIHEMECDCNFLRQILNGEKFDDIYIDVFLRGNRLWALRGDGQDCSLQGFIDLGMKYWKDFGEQS